MKTAERKMKNIKYIQGEKRSKWTNKQSIPDTSSCLSRSLAYVLAACRVACCPLPACSASPFATLSAARIGYVECPFNGLNTHTHKHSNASFYKPFRACTRVPRRLIAMNCCRMIFILFPLSVCASFVSFSAVTGTS